MVTFSIKVEPVEWDSALNFVFCDLQEPLRSGGAETPNLPSFSTGWVKTVLPELEAFGFLEKTSEHYTKLWMKQPPVLPSLYYIRFQ